MTTLVQISEMPLSLGKKKRKIEKEISAIKDPSFDPK